MITSLHDQYHQCLVALKHGEWRQRTEMDARSTARTLLHMHNAARTMVGNKWLKDKGDTKQQQRSNKHRINANAVDTCYASICN
jgi:hypothetical protein